MLGIIGVGTSRHRRPRHLQTRIAEAFEANPGRVIADYRIVPHHLKERAPTLGPRGELGAVRELFEQAVLLLRRAVKELVPIR